MEKLEQMKECLIGIVEGQVYGNLDKVNTKELGEAVDMIKDLAEAIYYCTITEAMKEGEEREEHHGTMYYNPKISHTTRYKERGMYEGQMAQKGAMGGMHSPNDGGEWPVYDEYSGHVYRGGMMRDPHEGRSGERRKMYMQGKSTYDKAHQMRELEAYMQELTTDITDMIQDASPEEKQMLQQKISTLATKIK